MAAARTGRAARETAAKRENIIVLREGLKESAEESRELLGVFDLKPGDLSSKLTSLYTCRSGWTGRQKRALSPGTSFNFARETWELHGTPGGGVLARSRPLPPPGQSGRTTRTTNKIQ